MGNNEKNRATTIKLTVILLFLTLILLWLIAFAAFIFIYTSLNEMTTEDALEILSSRPFILYLSTISLISILLLYKVIVTVKILDNYAVLDSHDINKMVAKSTAPFREKYYLIYNSSKQKDNKIMLLRKNLEKLQSKAKNNLYTEDKE